MDGDALVDKFSEPMDAAYPDHWLKENVSSNTVDAYKIFPEFNRSSAVTKSVVKEDAMSNVTANKQTNKMSSNTNDTRTGFILIEADTTNPASNITRDDLNKTIAAIRQSNVTANIGRERRSVDDGQAREARVHVARMDDDGDHGTLQQYSNNRRTISSTAGHHLLTAMVLVPMILIMLYLTVILIRMIKKTKQKSINLESGESHLSQVVIGQAYYERCSTSNDECCDVASNLSDMSCRFHTEKSDAVPRKRSLDKNRTQPQNN